MEVLALLVAAVCASLLGRAECSLAPFITACLKEDRECLLGSAQMAVPYIAEGVPELGMRCLDPMAVDRVATSEAGLDMTFNDTLVRGLRNCRVLDLEREDSQITLEMQCSVVLVGHYRLDGELLVVPIQGDGRYKITIRDIVVKVTLHTGLRSEGGQSYWNVLSWTHSAHVLTGVVFHFENLFNGDENLARSVTNFANTNWRDIFDEVSPPIVKTIVAQIVHETSKLFRQVPVADLSLD